MRPLAAANRRDVADAEVVEDAAELSDVERPGLFLQRPVRIVADEDIEAVAVEGAAAVRAASCQEGDVAVQVFGGPEVEGHDRAAGVVDGAEQRHCGAAILEPGELTAIEQNEGAHARGRRAAAAVLPGAPAVFGWLAEGPADPSHGGPADRQTFDLPEFLGGVAVIDVAVDGLQQRRHPGAQRAAQGPRGRLAAAAVKHAAQSLRPNRGLDPLELPDGQPGARRPLLVGDLPGQGQRDQPRSGHFFSAHSECLPCLHGVTFSRTS
jgi:hypothetical protein